MWITVAAFWRQLVLVLVPLALLPIILVPGANEVSRCAYAVLLMAIFWMSEALPLAITALIPIVLFPLFGIMSTDDVCKIYTKETNMMFLGGLMVAIAVEESGLHFRLALKVMLLVGTGPRWIMLGFMLTSAFLSMWINNTATIAMMVPIIEAVIEQLQEGEKIRSKISVANKDGDDTIKTLDHAVSVDSGLHESQITLTSINSKSTDLELSQLGSNGHAVSNAKENLTDNFEKNFKKLRLGLMLAAAYACNIGGTGALNGTAPNLVLKGIVEQVFGSKSGLNFATFTLFNFPTMLICILTAWIWLQLLFIRPLFCASKEKRNDERDAEVKRIIREKYEELERITFHELIVLILFILLILLWLFRDPKFIDGWDIFFPLKKVQDSTVVMGIVIILFVFPAQLKVTRTDDGKWKRPNTALTWNAIHEKLPWNIIFLIGGGFALAEGSKVSGLSKWIGNYLAIFKDLPPVAIVFIICLLTSVMTEVASNSATATIFLPVLVDMSKAIRLHPLYTMLPAAVSCSYAFMLPIATPPNAIVFSNAKMKNTDMLLPGIVLKLICIVVLNLMINTLGVYMFDLDNFPDWADDTNSTTIFSTMTNSSEIIDFTTISST